MSLQLRHNQHDGVSNHQPYACSLNRLFRHRWKKNTKATRHWPLWGGNHRWPVNSPHRRPVTRKMFSFDDVIMLKKLFDTIQKQWVNEYSEPLQYFHDLYLFISLWFYSRQKINFAGFLYWHRPIVPDASWITPRDMGQLDRYPNKIIINRVCIFSEVLCHGPLARYLKLWVLHAPGMPGTFSPPPRVSDPDMNNGTCVTHVPWCMSGSLTSGFLWSRWRGKCSQHSWCMRNPQFYLSGMRPMPTDQQLISIRICHLPVVVDRIGPTSNQHRSK